MRSIIITNIFVYIPGFLALLSTCFTEFLIFFMAGTISIFYHKCKEYDECYIDLLMDRHCDVVHASTIPFIALSCVLFNFGGWAVGWQGRIQRHIFLALLFGMNIIIYVLNGPFVIMKHALVIALVISSLILYAYYLAYHKSKLPLRRFIFTWPFIMLLLGLISGFIGLYFYTRDPLVNYKFNHSIWHTSSGLSITFIILSSMNWSHLAPIYNGVVTINNEFLYPWTPYLRYL
jgi:hypothetical protein